MGGRVFNDLDADGYYDYGTEPGISNVHVRIDGPVHREVVTNANGWWQVGGLPLGNYTVTVIPPAGYTVTSANPLHTSLVSPCQRNLYLHFGLNTSITPSPTPTYTPTATPTSALHQGRICGDVFLDDNEDGVFNNSDSPLSHILVRLLDAGDNLIMATHSDNTGRYCFFHLPAGTYKVQVDENDYNLPANAELDTPPNPRVVHLPEDGVAEEDFGFRVPTGGTTPSLDVIKRIVSPDGDIEPGDTVVFEVEIRNVGSVTLTKIPLVDEYDRQCLQYMRKTASPAEQQSEPGRIEWLDLVLSFGRYLEPGQSFIVRIPFTVLEDASGECVNHAIVDGAESYGQPVAGDEDSAGFVIVSATGVIGDQVWLDCNGNRVKDPDEGGIANVRVLLYQDDGDHTFEPGTDDALVAQTTTNADGTYLFDHLEGGTYWVKVDESSLPGLVRTTEENPILVVLPDGLTFLGADFGYAYPVTITGLAWLDSDGDGVKDDTETLGIGGVPVTATNAFGDTWTEYTDYEGRYTFSNLPPGTYTVELAPMDGMGNSTSRVHHVTVSCGQVSDGNDTGYTLPTAVKVVAIDAERGLDYIELRWRVQDANEVTGFYVYRSLVPDRLYELVTPYPVMSGADDPTFFRYRDENVKPGRTYYYKLVSVADGTVIGPLSQRTLGREDLSHHIYITLIHR